MNYCTVPLNRGDASAWDKFASVLADIPARTLWLPHDPRDSHDTYCVAKMRGTGAWWVCKFKLRDHIPTVGPFETWQQALSTLKLMA